VTFTLDGVKVMSACTTRIGLPANLPYDSSLKHYGNMTFEIRVNIDIQRSLKSRDSFLKRKFKNWALTCCRVGPILS